MKLNRIWILTGVLCLWSLVARAADPFAEGVRPTEPLTPAQQQKTFHLPPGFEIQLVAAEPDLRKPMNMAFDASGRLWYTESREYPFAATNAATARDTIRILSDFDANGRARTVTTFATNLNIPIGIYPFRSPGSSRGNEAPAKNKGKQSLLTSAATNLTWKCIAWSIPNIWLFEDTDGDGTADKKEILYGPFDHTRDTHGNQASFRRGNDGWLYATHGFNNDSRVKGRDGHEIHLNSGNTYRMRLDGSRLEHWTHGQVNPFGLAFDPLGNLYSADCHSSPIYQLLRGAHYPSFGKPHDGLGFAPVTIQHSHGSTAICGITHISDPSWPAEFQGNLFIGNVMTSRINRDRVEWRGSTSVGQEMPDFLSSDDPWFRPVDLQFGPDGALYVADFYNRIIGHYEVPLLHPGRDRDRGRIWRIVPPVGADVRRLKLAPDERPEPSRAIAYKPDALIAELSSPNPTRRSLALNELCDTHGKATKQAVFDAFLAPVKDSKHSYVLRNGISTNQQVSLLWATHRIDDLNGGGIGQIVSLALQGLELDKDLKPKPATFPVSEAFRIHAMRLSTELGLEIATDPKKYMVGSSGGHPPTTQSNMQLLNAAPQLLKDTNAFVQRAAVEAIGADALSGAEYTIRSGLPLSALIEFVTHVSPADTHLRHVARMALRDQLSVPAIMDRVTSANWPQPELLTLVDVALAVKSEKAASFLLRQDLALFPDAASQARVFEHAARYAPADGLTRLTELAVARIPKSYGLAQYQELERQFALFKSVDDGLRQRGGDRSAPVRAWGTNLVWTFFRALDGYHTWTASPLDTQPTAMPWDVQTRPCADGKQREVNSSFPHGEALAGVLRSRDFKLPEKLSFWLCGHNGFPDQPDHRKNVIRLRELGTKVILAEAYPPRNDIAQQITWDLKAHQGKQVYVEAVDGDTATAYAWMAFGGFEPELSQLRLSEFAPRKMRDWLIGALDLVARLQVKELAPQLGHWAAPVPGANGSMSHDDADPDTLEALARAWVAVDRDAAAKGLARQIAANDCQPLYRERLGVILGEVNSAEARAGVVQAFKAVPTRIQQRWANALAGSREGAEALLAATEQGLVARQLLAMAGPRNRIQAANPRDWEARLAKLTKDLPADSAERQKQIDGRRAAFDPAKASAAKGAEVFTKTCAVCHQLDGKGVLIGPQLDGVGGRGAERVIEDILDPNRNVDIAFRSSTFVLTDGEVMSGLFRREEGELLILAEATGKEVSIPKKQVKARRESESSLMPDNFADVISSEDFNHLLAYLLSKIGK